ncbi:hypothetical protein B7P43_G11899, partial [Cryptotermes secundus]
METPPVLMPSNKRTRHNSALNNSFTSEKYSETEDSPPVLRPKKRTKSISGILSQTAKESSELLPDCLLSSQEANLYMTPTKSVTPPENRVTIHIPATSPEHCLVTPQLRSKDNNANLFKSFLSTDAQNKSLQKLDGDGSNSNAETLIQSAPSSVILSGKEELVNQISSTVISSSSSSLQVIDHRKESLAYIQSSMWRVLSLSLLGSEKRVQWPTFVSLSKLLELWMSICSKIVCWLELTMKCIRKGYTSVLCYMSRRDQFGKESCCTCQMHNAKLEQRLSAVEKEVVKLKE